MPNIFGVIIIINDKWRSFIRMQQTELDDEELEHWNTGILRGFLLGFAIQKCVVDECTIVPI